MIRLRYLTLPVLAVLIVVSTVPLVSSDVLRGEFTVPNWVKNTAGWWASDQIPDSAFLQGIQYLIKEGIMIVEIPTEIDSEAAEEVPGWVKNTAGWWAEDKIHDITFVSGIKYLIGKGILVVMEPQVEAAKCNFKGKEVVCSLTEKEVVEIKDFYMEINGGSCSYCLNWAHVGKEYHFQIETFDEQHGKYIDGVKITAKIISKGGELRHDFGQVTTEDGIYKNSIVSSMDWYAENILSVTGEYYGVEKTIEKEFEVFVKRGADGTWQVRYMQALDAETDGANSFDELNGAHGVETYTIGSSTYAIVASLDDDGVQIIDISDPTAIVAKDSETDGANSFDELDGAWGVDTFTIGSSTYAIVASKADNGVQIIDISIPTAIVAKDAETDGVNGFDELDGAHGVKTYTIGSSTYAIVVSRDDNGVQIIDITNPSVIVAKDSETDGANSFDELDGADDVSTFVIGSSTYAIVVSRDDDGVQIIDITNPSVIVAKDSETDEVNGFTMLNLATSVDTFTIGSSTYAIVVSQRDDGVQMIDISDPDNIVAVDAETDGVNGFTMLNGAEDVETFTCGSRTYALVASNVTGDDNGVQLIDISNPANIIAIDAKTDGANGFTELEGVYNIEPFKIGSSQYAIATSYTDDGVQMIGMDCSIS